MNSPILPKPRVHILPCTVQVPCTDVHGLPCGGGWVDFREYYIMGFRDCKKRRRGVTTNSSVQSQIYISAFYGEKLVQSSDPWMTK